MLLFPILRTKTHETIRKPQSRESCASTAAFGLCSAFCSRNVLCTDPSCKKSLSSRCRFISKTRRRVRLAFAAKSEHFDGTVLFGEPASDTANSGFVVRIVGTIRQCSGRVFSVDGQLQARSSWQLAASLSGTLAAQSTLCSMW